MNTNVSIVKVGTRRYRVRTGLAGSSKTLAIDFVATSHNPPVDSKAKHGKSERISLHVPRQVHKFIIGARGSTLDKLRHESRAKITVPPERSKSDMVEIEGLLDERQKAEELIAQIVANNMAKVPYTHFVSLPLLDIDVQRKVGEFQRDAQQVLQNVDSSSFVHPGSLHITLGMLRLLSPKDVARAVEFLRSLAKDVAEIVGTKPLLVSIGHLATMEAASQARTIYAHADDFDNSGRLPRLCAFVRDRFDSAGYIDEKRELKIHISIVRAKPASGSVDEDDLAKKSSRGFSVNAGPLLKEFGTISFGVCRVGQIQIARRFRHAENGAYENDGALSLL
ncbi:activating signal cointegrator 1 complex subunit [Coemansia sp. RSA 1972]|nr:activating signal cointegrator 1 complex subunit [Coemansia sp. RSA 1972]